MSVLRFDCSFRYRSGFALAICFEADTGVTALVGPSGSGKTTTLQLIAGLLTPTRGRIQLGARTLFDAEDGTFVPPEQRSVGVVYQDYQLFPHLTVEQNLRYGLRRNPKSPFGFAHLVEVLELGEYLDRYPLSLSGGQRQRTALGRAILRGPELLLLDEPLSALDDALKASVMEFLRRLLREYPVPTLLVSHDAASVASLAAKKIEFPAVR